MSNQYILGTIDETGLGHPCQARICWTLTDALQTGFDRKSRSNRLRALIMWGEVYDTNMRQRIVGGQCIDELVQYFRSDPVAQELADIARRWSYNHLRRGSLIQEDHLRSHKYPGYPLEFESWARCKLKIAGLDPCPHTGHTYGSGYVHEALPMPIIHHMVACATEDYPNAQQHTAQRFRL